MCNLLVLQQNRFRLDYQLSVYLGFATTIVCIVLFFAMLKPLGERDEEAYVNN